MEGVATSECIGIWPLGCQTMKLKTGRWSCNGRDEKGRRRKRNNHVET